MSKSKMFIGDANPFLNQIKMFYHSERLLEWKTTGSTTPILIEINLVNVCNQACRWCISMSSHISNPGMSLDEKQQLTNQNKRGLDFERLITFIHEIKSAGVRAVTWSGGGEPTIYYRFPDLIKAIGHSMEQGLITNGQFNSTYIPIIAENIKWVRVSLDTFDKRQYEFQKMSKQHSLVIDNIKLLKQHPIKVGLNMNVAEWNKDEIISFAIQAASLGVDYVQYRPVLGLPFELKTNSLYLNQLNGNLVEEIKTDLLKAEELQTDKFKVHVSWDKFTDVVDTINDFGRTYKKCLGHSFMCVLDANGDVDVCMYHLDNDIFKMGNIYKNSFSEIWESEKRKEVAQHCAQTIDFSKCQSCCKLHNLNKLLDILEQDIEDINFI